MRESTKYVMDRITHSLIELMNETPIGNISICAVIDNAEVSRNSFYRHFQDKDDILRYYISSETEQWLSRTGISYLNASSPQDYIVFLLTIYMNIAVSLIFLSVIIKCPFLKKNSTNSSLLSCPTLLTPGT